MRSLDLFSGIGGFALGLEWAGIETVGFAEIDPFACKVLELNWPHIPNYGDVSELDGSQFYGKIDLITGGVPCQPASVAGDRKGSSDSRWKWPDAIRIVRESRPRWVIFENPTGIMSLDNGVEFRHIIGEIALLGYSVWYDIISARAVGAGHRRDRVWIIAHADNTGLEGQCGHDIQSGQGEPEKGSYRLGSTPVVFPVRRSAQWWTLQSPVCPVVDGVSDPAHWRQTIIAAGNAVVPQIPYMLAKGILEVD